MNKVILKGTIRNISPSHKIGDVEYYKAEIITKRDPGKEDLLCLCFKKFSCPYSDGDEVELVANARSYSTTSKNGKNHVNIYYYTYFDKPTSDDCQEEYNNHFEIDGNICKINPLYTNENGKHSIQFILANNISTNNGSKINSYLPCIALGKLAREISKLSVGDKVLCIGECHSRYYKTKIDENDYEIRVAHEMFITKITKVTENGEDIQISI